MPVSTKPSKRPIRNSSDDPEEFRMSLAGHIDELRSRIIRVVLIVAAGWVIGWFLQTWVYDTLNSFVQSAVEAYRRTHPNVQYAEPFKSLTEPFMVKFKLSFMIGLGLALPVIVLEIWGFVRPGLKPSEARPIMRLAPVSVVLFFLGVACCWLILPLTFQWFLSYLADFPGTALFQEPGTMIFFTLKMMLGFGLGFQLPLVVFIAGQIGLVSSETLSQYWRHAAVFVFIASAILTPSQDIITMLMMAIPLTLLVMLSILAVKITTRNKRPISRPEELDELD